MKTIGLFLALMVFAIAVEAKTIRILVYGDSNSYGWAPEPNPPSVRFPIDQSWPGVMQKVLGDQYEVIIEALPGRTTDIADPEAPISGAGFDGTAYLPAAMASHAPLDLVVIMLGTNDTKPAYKRTPYRIALGAASLVEIASTPQQVGVDYPVAKVLLICPPPLGPQFTKSATFEPMFRGGLEISKQLPPLYEGVAKLRGAAFFDAGTAITTDGSDGIHFSAESHQRLGEAVATKVKSMVGDRSAKAGALRGHER